MKTVKQNFRINDIVTTKGDYHTFKIGCVSLGELGQIYYRENLYTPWFPENLLTLVESPYLDNDLRECEICDEADFEPQKYLSRLNQKTDADEAVKYFTKENLLEEIGVDDCIDHFGESTIIEEIGKQACESHFKYHKDYR